MNIPGVSWRNFFLYSIIFGVYMHYFFTASWGPQLASFKALAFVLGLSTITLIGIKQLFKLPGRQRQKRLAQEEQARQQYYANQAQYAPQQEQMYEQYE